MSSELLKNKIGIIGAGTMGSGIAHVSALSGFSTVLIDINEVLVQKGLDIIKNNLNRQISKNNSIANNIDEVISKIEFSTEFSTLKSCDLIIEAITEDFKLKSELFIKLDKICHYKTILASNTSSISITKIAACTQRPNQVIGMHFMNPVPIMKLVEVIKGESTSDNTKKIVLEVAKKMGKIPIECNDSPGFISNRILMPMINEAIFCLYEGVGTPEAIDSIMKTGMAHPMGPLRLADLIGLDVCLNIINVMYSEFNDNKYSPCPLLIEKVNQGHLSKKNGIGFYNYN